MIYKIPEEYYFRIHHIRPRFKNDLEGVLIYMATEISKIGKKDVIEFKEEINQAIYRYPGNINKELKTINNWRTEISALFGLIETFKDDNVSKPGSRAVELADQQDLVKFFKKFLYYFQYPGGHLKPKETEELVKKGIKFKPARYILKLLKDAESNEGKRVGITRGELTHCVFNDLRVTRDGEDQISVWSRIKNNRDKNVKYDETGDVIRYASDILDYMEIANLITSHGGMFYLNQFEMSAIEVFTQSDNWFNLFEQGFKIPELTAGMVQDLQEEWFSYVNQKLDEGFFETDILALIAADEEDYKSLQANAISSFREKIGGAEQVDTKEIGDVGENLVHGHECMRVKIGGREDLIHLIKCIPNALAAGYDIRSVELDETHRYVEVKTTISNRELVFSKFHLTPNEWKAAESNGERYHVYRLLLSKHKLKLFILRDPVGQYKANKLEMTPRDGVDINFDPDRCGEFADLLLWKN